MSLVSKLKNILFEEEEIEIPIIEKKEKPASEKKPVYNELPKKEEVIKNTNFEDFYNEDNTIKPKSEVVTRQKEETVSEREIFKSEKTFNFPAFDEEEFKSMAPKPRATNVMEYEKRKNEKRQDYKAPLKKEVKEEKPKFKPSPIISPVYGILDKNYTPDEITSRSETVSTRTLDVDSVRRKAFGTLEEKKEEVVKEEIEDKIFEEKLEKARTIDELLKDSSDEVIPLEEEEIIKNDETLDEDLFESFNEVESLEDIEPKKEVSVEDDDTIESDLFDLIDSMYENREDGE